MVDLPIVVRGTEPPGRTFASYGDVHGKKGDRFLYVCWVDRVVGMDHGFRRGKLMLDRIEPGLVTEAVEGGRTLVATVSLTDKKGGPRCARYDPPAIVWSVG